ncbi:MAG: tetratricopeptide repeat protein [Rubrivivax sp.]
MNTLQTWVVSLVAALGAVLAGPASAQSFALESAVLDSATGRNLGVTSERGEIAALFRAQKAVTFGVLRAAGIPLESLPPDIRQRIERFQTTNLEAFRAFSEGLSLKDQGRYAQARESFRRAAQLDPNFALAVEQQQAMPDVNIGGSVQLRAAVAAAAGAAVDRGKQTYAIDASRAVAAMQAGQNVVVVPPTETARANDSAYTSNPAGATGQFVPNLAVALAYRYTADGGVPVTLDNNQEWRNERFRVANNVLEAVGEAGEFQALRGGAQAVASGETSLADGTRVQWGQWNSAPGASASVRINGVNVVAPVLGTVDTMFAEATPRMPGSGTATFTPRGGSLQDVSGSIRVDFANRAILLQTLGFRIGDLNFSNLSGQAEWAANSAAGSFRGNYTGGSCAGCLAFLPAGSNFAGTFAGKDAAGILFSTFLNTGSSFVGGTQVFGR